MGPFTGVTPLSFPSYTPLSAAQPQPSPWDLRSHFSSYEGPNPNLAPRDKGQEREKGILSKMGQEGGIPAWNSFDGGSVGLGAGNTSGNVPVPKPKNCLSLLHPLKDVPRVLLWNLEKTLSYYIFMYLKKPPYLAVVKTGYWSSAIRCSLNFPRGKKSQKRTRGKLRSKVETRGRDPRDRAEFTAL